MLKIIREVLENFRGQLLKKGVSFENDEALKYVTGMVLEKIEAIQGNNLKWAINGTGVIIHTNLGRAPLAKEAVSLIKEVSQGYSNLEFNLDEGQRGIRTDHVRDLLLRLTGAEEALVVNNNAGAVLISLNSLAEGREVIVSRGELVEIGSSFRIPEVMGKSGAIMREVGTTNRTHLSDFEEAITDKTGLLLKVHTSNYKIMGFSAEVALKDLVELGRKHRLPVMMDLGSGNLTELSGYGLKGEPTIREVLSSGCDLVTFSGDKLLGGPQAGIILTQGGLDIGLIRTNPLARALRIDKLTLAALEATLRLYQRKDSTSMIPVLRMITMDQEEAYKRAQAFFSLLVEVNQGMMDLTLKKDFSPIGGGALPTQSLPTWVVAFSPGEMTTEGIEETFRHSVPPVIGRINEGMFLLDCRTISDQELPIVVRIYEEIVKGRD